jgi:uncharacterized membrane protein YoaK (UPF0700 family)
MEQLSQLKQRFSAMPWLLRTLVAASLGIGLGFSLLPLVPGASFGLGERELTYQELWQTRVAFAVLAVGVLMLVVGLAVFLRKSWVRPVLVVLPFLQLLPFLAVHWLFGAPNPVSSPVVLGVSSIVWAVAAVVYLFGTRSGREHFANAV